MSMLKARWRNPAWTNVYVTNVHGCARAVEGAKAKVWKNQPPVKTVMVSRYTTAFAAITRRTHGVNAKVERSSISFIYSLTPRLCSVARPGARSAGRSCHTARENQSPALPQIGEAGWCA